MKQTAVQPSAVLSARIRERAREMGFDAVGIAPVHRSAHGDAYRRWIAQEMHGEMAYLSREDALEKRADPAVLVPGARSAVVVALNYDPGDADRGDVDPIDVDLGDVDLGGVDPGDIDLGDVDPRQVALGDAEDVGDDASRGIIARYARNDDYHELMKERLIALQDWISAELIPLRGRAYVDTGAVLERELAQRAGLGWQGKNTMLINPRRGSYFFIGEVLVDVELEYDPPFAKDHCGTCRRCLDACPTGALLGRDVTGAPVMDARRCISYLTIELRGPIPRDLRPMIGNRIYGCDICAEVCPWNRFSETTDEAAFLAREGFDGPSLIEWMTMTQEEFSRRFKNSPIKRTKRRGLLRNVAVALGNWGSPDAVPVLAAALNDEEALVRGHVAWALGRISDERSVDALRARLLLEADKWVISEIRSSLDES